jgi:hypothetical protein
MISLHRIYYDSVAHQCYRQDLVSQYQALQVEDRLRFIVDILKIASWIVSQTFPVQFFYLATNVRIQTRLKHHATSSMRDGIVKESHLNSDRQILMEIIRAIYNAC